jgi:hypothetical protein
MKRVCFFKADQADDATLADRKRLKDQGIKTIMDLRTV